MKKLGNNIGTTVGSYNSAYKELGKIDNLMLNFRTFIRNGQEISGSMMEEQLNILTLTR